MSLEVSNYLVTFSKFSERHFEKNFAKKYKDKWPRAKQTIIFLCERIDKMLSTNRADLIIFTENAKLIKLDFAVNQKKESPKTSGNRCIVFVDEKIHSAEILLIYSKNDIGPPNETQKWKNIISDEFPKVAIRFKKNGRL